MLHAKLCTCSPGRTLSTDRSSTVHKRSCHTNSLELQSTRAKASLGQPRSVTLILIYGLKTGPVSQSPCAAMQSPDSVLTSKEYLQQTPSYSKLLPELLLALLGHTGDVFVEKTLFMASGSGQQPPPERCNFAVTDAPGLVSSSERCCLFWLLWQL